MNRPAGTGGEVSASDPMSKGEREKDFIIILPLGVSQRSDLSAL